MSLLDRSYILTPLIRHLKWCYQKYSYENKYKKSFLKIDHDTFISDCIFGKYNWIGSYSLLSKITLGDHSYIAGNSVISNCMIGKFCSIGPNVRIAPGNHPTNTFVSTHPSTFANHRYLLKSFVNHEVFKSNSTVIIGNDVWIGANCLIVDGITIADGAIIGANSVVTKNVGPYVIVGGVPAKIIKKRFNEEQIEKLLTFKWWDKGEDWIQNNVSKFQNIDNFISSFI